VPFSVAKIEIDAQNKISGARHATRCSNLVMKNGQPTAAQCSEALRLCTQLVAAREGPVDPMKARNKAPNAALNQQARGGGLC
jgi:hypothetical protein